MTKKTFKLNLINGSASMLTKKNTPDPIQASLKKNKLYMNIERDESVINASLERDKSVTNTLLERDKSVTKKSIKKQIKEKSVINASLERDESVTESVTNASLERDYIFAFENLSNQENELIEYLFEACILNGQRKTKKIINKKIQNHLKTTSGSLRTLIRRLKKHTILDIIKTKNGPSGWRIFGLPKGTYQYFTEHRNIRRALLERDESVTNAGARALLNSTSSNSSIILNTNTTTKSDNWTQEIQTPENIKKIGIGFNHIKQLNSKFGLSPKEIQLGLEAFSYDLENGERERLKARGIQNLIGYFFGAMKSGGYNSVKENFISAEDLAEQEMLERLELKKKEREERKSRLQELLFLEWIEKKSKEELCEISKPMLNYLDEFHKGSLKNYFLKNEIHEFSKEVNNAANI